MTNSRAKGAEGEREVARLLRSYGWEARRGQQFHGGPDSPDVVGLPGFHIEVKRVEKLNLVDAMAQSVRDAGSDTPVVFHRKNHCDWLVTMRVDDFMNMAAEWIHGKELDG